MLTNRDYDFNTVKTWVLVDEETGSLVVNGDVRKDFRGEKATVTGFAPPRHPGSTGRIYVERSESYSSECYPSVFNCKIVPFEGG